MRFRNEWWVIPLAIIMPLALMGAYEPAALLAFNNLSDLSSAATARTNLGLGTAATQNVGTFFQVSNNLSEGTAATMRTNLGLGTAATKAATAAGANVASVTGSFTSGHCISSNDTAGTSQDAGGPCGVGVTVATYASTTATLTLSTTPNNRELIAQTPPAALTINLPTVASVSSGFITCVKDKANNFNTYNATVKTTDSTLIDTQSGSTGFVMNQHYQSNCFYTDGTNWFVE